MDTTFDDIPIRRTLPIVGRKPSIKLFNKLHHVKSPQTEPPQPKTKITPRTRKHFKQNKLNLTGKPKALVFDTIAESMKVDEHSPSKSKIKTGVSGCYNGKNGSPSKVEAAKHFTKNLSNFTLEAGSRRSGRKYICEDDASNGLRVNRQRKNVLNHRMHYEPKNGRVAPWQQLDKRGMKCSPRSWKNRPQTAAVDKVAPFGLDSQPRAQSSSGKRYCRQSHQSTRNLLC